MKNLKQLNTSIPPLIGAYMNLSSSMKSFGTALNTKFGDVEETGNLKYLFELLQAFGFELNLYLILGFLSLFFILKGCIQYLGNAYRVTAQQFFVKNYFTFITYLVNPYVFSYII